MLDFGKLTMSTGVNAQEEKHPAIQQKILTVQLKSMDGVEIHGNYGLPTLAVVVDSINKNIHHKLSTILIT
jgi:hypothetical protein